MIMKKFEVIWVISLFIILLLGINYLVSGQNRISNFIFGIFLFQVLVFIIYKLFSFKYKNQ
jgi:hypothetical protein